MLIDHGRKKNTLNQTPGFSKVSRKHHLVGGFNPFDKYWSKWQSTPNRGEHKKYLKPPPNHPLRYHKRKHFDPRSQTPELRRDALPGCHHVTQGAPVVGKEKGCDAKGDGLWLWCFVVLVVLGIGGGIIIIICCCCCCCGCGALWCLWYWVLVVVLLLLFVVVVVVVVVLCGACGIGYWWWYYYYYYLLLLLLLWWWWCQSQYFLICCNISITCWWFPYY